MHQTGNGIRAVERTLDLLEALRDAPKGVRELARACDLSKSTVHRILTTLEARGYVVQSEDTDKYRLGLTLFSLGSAAVAHGNLLQIADAVMKELAKRTGETIRLAVPYHDELLIIHQVEGTNLIRFAGPVGVSLPLHCTAAGKLVLASLSPAEVARIAAEKGLRRYGPRCITNLTQLQQDLEKVRVQGYAINDEENAEDACGVAAPIYDAGGRMLGAILVLGPANRLPSSSLPEWGRVMIEAAERISAALGWKGLALAAPQQVVAG